MSGRNWKPGADLVKADKDKPLWDSKLVKEITEKTESVLNDITKEPKRCFVNVYRDSKRDRFISDEDYESYDEAYELRDKDNESYSIYIETVEIIRKP